MRATRREQAYSAMLRIAKINQMKALQNLLTAQRVEREHHEQLTGIANTVEAIIEISRSRRIENSTLDMAHYELLSDAVEKHQEKYESIETVFEEAKQARVKCSTVAAQFGRRHDFLKERIDQMKKIVNAADIGKERDQGLDLWIGWE